MTAHNYSNTASTAQLDAPLNSSSNTFQVTGFTGYPSAPFYILMDRDTSSAELLEVTQVAGSTLTATRGAGGTASTSHAAGAAVEHVIPAAVPQAVEAHVEATTNVHGVTGALVGADDTGVLSNKTYRGAHRHVYSDSQPEAPAAGYIVEADSSLSRDGFVAAGVGANTDRRGFLLTQSGANRFEARYDGTVKITPSGASARPGLEVTTGITADTLTTTHDATVGEDLSVANLISANALTVANANVSSGLAVTGTSTLNQVNAAGTVTASASGTGLQVTNNASVGGTLAVAGAGTSLTLSGANARLRFPATATAGTPGAAAGEVRYRNRSLEVYDGSSWYAPGAASGITFAGGASGAVGSQAEVTSIPITGFASGAPYYVLLGGQIEINDPGNGNRWDLFARLDGPDGDVLGVGVGPGLAQIGFVLSPQLTGDHEIYFMVERTVGGSGTTTVTAFNQNFTYLILGTNQAA